MSREFWLGVTDAELALLTERQIGAVAVILHGATQREGAETLGISRNALVQRLDAAQHTIEQARRIAA